MAKKGRQLWHEHSQADEHDTVAILQGQHYTVEAAHLVVADGASSPLRRSLGIQMQGDAALQHLVNIHFNCPSIWRLVANRPAMLYFVFSSKVIAVLVAHNLEEGELVAQVGRPVFLLQHLSSRGCLPCLCSGLAAKYRKYCVSYVCI